jgi:protein TonB
MSYKSLLFCPDEKTARAVTQVLTELEFTVDPANEPFGAVKKLTEERFDALVVDCQNEQDASLLFNTARDSAQNHSSLSVAVVEGQAGVAKAFRIGANLVLTKPINVEQSKGTLRVARGLLRKNEAKAASVVASPKTSFGSSSTQSSRVSFTASPAAPIQAPPPQSDAPFSVLEVESDPVPAAEASEIAVLESLPDIGGKPAPPVTAPALRTAAESILATTSGQAAAVAPALEKVSTLGLSSASSTAPMVTNEPIVADKHYADPLDAPPIDVPSFSSLEASARQGSVPRFFKFAVVMLVVGVAGYFGWQKLQPLNYIQKIRAAHSASASDASQAGPSSPETSAPEPASTPSAISSTQATNTSSVQAPATPDQTPTLSPDNEVSAEPESVPKSNKIETIEVQEMPSPGDPKPAAPKPQPLVVRPDSGTKRPRKPGQTTAPPSQISSLNSSGSGLPNLAGADAALPTLAPGSMHVSQGVSQGLLLKKVPPAYPAMALQLHKEGAVELLATISKQGLITSVKVLSGDAMLSKPAADAVRQWKYRPYLLNGEPVEIQTQITITFKAPH